MNASSPFARAAALYLRLALATAFLSAVADRLGLWGPPGSPGVAWGEFGSFLDYTAFLLPFLPAGALEPLGWGVTAAEAAFGLALLAGFRVRAVAGMSGLLLLSFAVAMMIGEGVKAPFDASVFAASAGALLLWAYPDSYLSVDGSGG